MSDFLTLKMLPLAVTLIKIKNLFAPLVMVKLSLAIENSKFACKMSIFWPMGQKGGDFLFWSMPEPMVTFLGLKNHSSP